MWKMNLCLRPSVLATYCHHPTLMSDFHEILDISSLPKVLSKYEFSGNWLSTSLILLKVLSEFLPAFPLFRGRWTTLKHRENRHTENLILVLYPPVLTSSWVVRALYSYTVVIILCTLLTSRFVSHVIFEISCLSHSAYALVTSWTRVLQGGSNMTGTVCV